MQTKSRKPLYQIFADDLGAAIKEGRLAPGEQLPSLREATQQRGFSLNTVVAAYQHLEARGWIETRPQSGHFVKVRLPILRETSPVVAPKPCPADLAVLV